MAQVVHFNFEKTEADEDENTRMELERSFNSEQCLVAALCGTQPQTDECDDERERDSRDSKGGGGAAGVHPRRGPQVRHHQELLHRRHGHHHLRLLRRGHRHQRAPHLHSPQPDGENFSR